MSAMPTTTDISPIERVRDATRRFMDVIEQEHAAIEQLDRQGYAGAGLLLGSIDFEGAPRQIARDAAAALQGGGDEEAWNIASGYRRAPDGEWIPEEQTDQEWADEKAWAEAVQRQRKERDRPRTQEEKVAAAVKFQEAAAAALKMSPEGLAERMFPL
jgi:hypothetical protein